MSTRIFGKWRKGRLLVLVPLILSAYTHLWNVTGFPSVHIDEAHYMRRAMLVINGMGPQESASTGYPRTYDHPYFGQLFLGGILELIGYPNMYYSGDNAHSIEMLHFIPRIIMGILAVIDTFLLYGILQIRYNRTVALISAILFAVMPMTWLLRRVYLDTLLMPFLLASILFALYIQKSRNENSKPMYSRRIDYRVFVLLSGIFLGLTIYTKIPAITFIPLIGYLIYLNSRKVRILIIWLVPVILIPFIWPLYSVIAGQSDLWVQWVLWQTERDKPLGRSLNSFFQIDPIITIGGVAGLVLAALWKDFFPLVWIAPFIAFSFLIGYVQYFHLIVIFPAFCTAFGILIDSVQGRIKKHLKIYSNIIIISISIFGIVITTTLITLNVNSANYDIYTSIAHYLPSDGKQVTLIGSHWWDWNSYWLTRFVMNKDHEMIDPMFDTYFRAPVKTDKVLFVDDPNFEEAFSRNIRGANIVEIRQLYDNSKPVVVFHDNMTKGYNNNYPFNILEIMTENENHPQGNITLRANY